MAFMVHLLFGGSWGGFLVYMILLSLTLSVFACFMFIAGVQQLITQCREEGIALESLSIEMINKNRLFNLK